MMERGPAALKPEEFTLRDLGDGRGSLAEEPHELPHAQGLSRPPGQDKPERPAGWGRPSEAP